MSLSWRRDVPFVKALEARGYYGDDHKLPDDVIETLWELWQDGVTHGYSDAMRGVDRRHRV